MNDYVLDVNTLISAFLLSETSVAAKCYYKAKDTGRIVCSDDIFNELADVFIRPKFDRYLVLEKRLQIIDELKGLMTFVPVSIVINACRDPKDDKFLELAIASRATCIVTGDKDLLVLHPFHEISIVTPADFLLQF